MNKLREALLRVGRWLISVVPTRRLVAIVAVASLLWLLSSAAAVVALLLIAIAVAADLLLLPAPWQIVVERVVSPNVGLGDDEHGEYRVRSTFPKPVRFELYDALPPVIRSPEPRGATLVVKVGAETVVPFTFVADQRGSFPLGPVVVRIVGARDLIQRTLRSDPTDEVLVTPSLAGVKHLRLLAVQHRLRDAGIRSIRRRGEGTTFASLREYAVGDDPRHVDWKATARRQKLMTREYTVEQGQTVVI
ncbi:MAG: DUF58 domain-containing protein, partial [Gemmatimonadaceae bacterium]